MLDSVITVVCGILLCLVGYGAGYRHGSDDARYHR